MSKKKYNPLFEYYVDKNNEKIVEISLTAYIVYTFHLSLHLINPLHLANFGQFKAKQVLSMKTRTLAKTSRRTEVATVKKMKKMLIPV